MLETLKVRSRLGIIVLAAFVGFAVLATASIFHLRDTMMQDRQTKTRHLVEVAIGVVNAFHELEVQENSAATRRRPVPPMRCAACATSRTRNISGSTTCSPG